MLLVSRLFDNKFYISFFALLIILNILFQLVIILAASNNSIYILVGYNVLLLLIAFYKKSFNNLSILLIIINFLPLIYLNNEFHYHFTYEILTAFPLFLLILLAISHFLLNSRDLSFKITYLQKPIIYIVIYFSVLGAVGMILHQSTIWIIQQLFHFYLYLLIFPISYLFYKRDFYFSGFSFLLIISVVIAFEYIVLNQLLLNFRFVTFQSGFLPLVSGVLFSYVLYNKNTIRRIVATVLLFIVTAGAFVTLTRTLWVTTILVLFLVWFFYLKSENKLSIYKIVLLIIISLPLFLIWDMDRSSNQKISQSNIVEYRTQSVVNPLEDRSFLMRVEFVYYASQRFLESPIFGKGLGDFLKYQIFNISDAANYYIDNSWLYFLWKGGLIGFLLFAWLYIRFFRASYFVLKNTPDIRVKYIALGLLGGFIGLSFLGVLSPLLIKYKTNALIAFFFAYIEFERLKIVNDSKSEKTLSVKT